MSTSIRPAVALASALCLLAATAHADLTPAREALGRGDYGVAEPLVRAARGAERTEADRLLGRLLLETGRYDEARTLGERLGRNASTRVDGLTLEGEALVASGRYDEALARWNQALVRARAGVGRRARALAGTWLARLGRPQEAQDLAQPLIDEYNDAQQEAEDHPDAPGRLNPRTAVLRDAEALTYLGMAMRALGFVQDANQAFGEAIRAEPRRVEALTESAELYLSKEDMGHAGEALREALAVNPRHARALALRARTRLMNDLDFAHAIEDLDLAVRSNPRLPEAFALRAQIVLRDGDVAQAERLVAQALAIDPKHLESLATRAVVRFDVDDSAGFRQALDALFAVSPAYVDAYALLGDFADWEHRYEEAAALMREGLARPAIAQQPRIQGQLRAQLGINLLRLGDETGGLTELRESFRTDRYNVRVYNLLNLYEDTLARDYGVENSGPFVVRYPNAERAVLRRYVPQLLQRAYRDMVARYHFTPRGPLSIELYGSTEHFSVRTSGLPEIGVQGVCFGRVITAISPAGGQFNWGQILWHELAHVFAIQLSRSRVPRWFTEGLSEWEAFHSHPEWAREDDASLFRALARDRIPRVAEFNTAFTHARSGDEMLVAYFAASKLVEFMIDRYGFERVAALLPRWGRGQSTQDVIREGLGVSAEELDRQFRAHTRTRLARFESQFVADEPAPEDREALARRAAERPTDADAQARAAAADLAAGEGASARTHAQAALRLVATHPQAHWVLARVALRERDAAGALREIDALLSQRRDGYVLRAFEAQAARAARDESRLRAALESATRQDPSQAEAWEQLAELHRRAGREPERVRALRELVRLDQHNRAALRALLGAYVTQGAWREIRSLTEHARNLDPEDASTHVALARAAATLGERTDAIYEYESALALSPREAGPLHAALAALYAAAGDRARAARESQAAAGARAPGAGPTGAARAPASGRR